VNLVADCPTQPSALIAQTELAASCWHGAQSDGDWRWGLEGGITAGVQAECILENLFSSSKKPMIGFTLI
jgi:hypothetical protein